MTFDLDSGLAEAVRQLNAVSAELTKEIESLPPMTREQFKESSEKFDRFKERYPWFYPTSEEVERVGLECVTQTLFEKLASMTPLERDELIEELNELVAIFK